MCYSYCKCASSCYANVKHYRVLREQFHAWSLFSGSQNQPGNSYRHILCVISSTSFERTNCGRRFAEDGRSGRQADGWPRHPPTRFDNESRIYAMASVWWIAVHGIRVASEARPTMMLSLGAMNITSTSQTTVVWLWTKAVHHHTYLRAASATVDFSAVPE